MRNMTEYTNIEKMRDKAEKYFYIAAQHEQKMKALANALDRLEINKPFMDEEDSSSKIIIDMWTTQRNLRNLYNQKGVHYAQQADNLQDGLQTNVKRKRM